MSTTEPQNETLIGLSLLNAGLGSRIVLTNEYGEYSVFIKRTDLTLPDTFESLIIPLLLSSGFAQSTIDNYLNA